MDAILQDEPKSTHARRRFSAIWWSSNLRCWSVTCATLPDASFRRVRAHWLYQ